MNPEQLYYQFLNNNPYPRFLKNHDQERLINFSSNDYLGLAKHPLLIKRSNEFVKLYGTGGSSSRLVSGNSVLYEQLEKKLSEVLKKPAALILGTGYQTNISVLEALLDKTILKQDPLIFCDKFCHASIVMGLKQYRIQRFQHNNLTHLENLLEKYANSSRPKYIVVESIYSMDGDEADLSKLIAIKKKYGAFLYVDDAHAVGIYGPNGWGKTVNYADDIDIIMGTFSKGLGSYGGYIACSTIVRDFLVNKCKGLIYSTSLPPSILGAISSVFELMPSLDKERKKCQQNAQQLREYLTKLGINHGASTTHIVPWVIGDANKAMRASILLEKNGILGAAIRPPSVLAGQSRIRFCLSALHTETDIERLKDAIQKVVEKI